MSERAAASCAEAPPGDYRGRKKALLDALRASGPGTRGVRAALTRLSALADDALRALWAQRGFDDGPALLAVGGYGRGELFP